jgi:hypothetical protein
MQGDARVPNACKESELPLKITQHSSKSLPLWHQVPKGLVILRRRRRRIEWRRWTELWWWSWSRIVMIKMISEISKSSVQGMDIVLKLSLLHVTAGTALRWTSERIFHLRH